MYTDIKNVQVQPQHISKYVFLDRIKMSGLHNEHERLSETISAKIYKFQSSINDSKAIEIGPIYTH